MGELSARKKHVKRTVDIGNVASQAEARVADLDARIEAIKLLILLGLQAVTDELQQAVGELAGPRYQRKTTDQPWRRMERRPGGPFQAKRPGARVDPVRAHLRLGECR